MNRPKLSVVIAVYNTEAYLRQCLDSVLHQTAMTDQYEVIVVDDGSTDRSGQIIDEYDSKYNNLHVIHKENEATYLCRQDGMREAQGEYVLFVDSDDWLCENALEELIKSVSENAYDMVEFGIYDEAPDDTRENVQLPEGEYRRNEIFRRLVERRMTVELWHRMFSRKVIRAYLDYFDTHYRREDFVGIRIEDEYLFPALLRHVNMIKGIEIPLYHYREASTGSMMKRVDTEADTKLLHARTLLEAGFFMLKEAGDDRSLSNDYYYSQIQNLFYYMGCILKFGARDEITQLKEYYKEWKRYRYRLNGICAGEWKWHGKVFIRKWHLCYKYHRVIRMKAMERGNIG